MMNRDSLFAGSGKAIVQAAYRVIDAVQYEPKPRQVQAVALVIAAMCDVLKIRLPELVQGIIRVVHESEGYATTKALTSYVKVKLGEG